ncbi:MAG TPA: glycosyl transferase family 36 [Elusimicrobiota bacterium]|nr:glycosyl transferase family 36 [Elusimicrobiota bacterium]
MKTAKHPFRFPFKTNYGRFSEDGRSYIITRPDTPRPWVNVISTGPYGAVISQTGSGYSWLHHASLNRLTRWDQDMIRDEAGRYLYIRDEQSGRFWSASWQPTKTSYEFYECVHGVGYSIITMQKDGIRSEWMIFVPEGEPLEVWRVRIRNVSKKTRKLSLWSYMEWNLGEAPDWHREFHKLFIETSFHDADKVILAKKRLSPLKNEKGEHWNKTWEYTAWHAVNLPVTAACGDKQAFLGNYGSKSSPAALQKGAYVGPTTHRWDDGIASLQVPVTLKPGEERTSLWTLGAATSEKVALNLAKKYQNFSHVEKAWHQTEILWDKLLGSPVVETPDAAFNVMTNVWLKYQAMSARFFGRTAYYQTGGAYGFRDQLQDSQVFLPVRPDLTLRQIRLHCAHQFASGRVFHWWHPLSEEGAPSRYSDDLLWLPFVVLNYLKETVNYSALLEKVPYHPGPENIRLTEPIYRHCVRAIDNVLNRFSERGLPLIGTGDWNDGLSATGRDEKGESVWMGHFLYGVLMDWSRLMESLMSQGVISKSEDHRRKRYLQRAARLKKTINRLAWDGRWYSRATCDDGTVLGSRQCRDGKIFLNAQTWALMNGIVDSPQRKRSILSSLQKHLYGPHGSLLLYPAYRTPDSRIGYLTRYAPGTRENGGIYMHAAVWAIQMECAISRPQWAWELYRRLCPVYRGMDPERYVCEPYVTPGNVDGPDSPTPGRGGWTWYTGSAAWLFRISTEWMMGIRPDWDGLRIRPCIPKEWNGFRTVRRFRGAEYRIRVLRDKTLRGDRQEILFDGKKIVGDLLPSTPGKQHDVVVLIPES